MLVGSFIARASSLNLSVVIVFGVLGLLLKRHNFSRPAFLLGFVLGRLLEDYTLLSLQVSGPLFFMTPISLILFVILIGLFCYPYLKKILPKFRWGPKKA